DDAVEHRRRARDLAARIERPPHVARAGVQGEELLAVGAHEHRPLPDRGGRVDVAARRLCPEDMAAVLAKSVDPTVRVADEHAPVGDRRRGVEVRGAARRPAELPVSASTAYTLLS